MHLSSAWHVYIWTFGLAPELTYATSVQITMNMEFVYNLKKR